MVAGGTAVCQGGPYADNVVRSTECCVVGNYTLRCIDTYGDGWHGGQISVNGVEYCHNFTTGALIEASIVAPTAGGITVEIDSSDFQWNKVSASGVVANTGAFASALAGGGAEAGSRVHLLRGQLLVP